MKPTHIILGGALAGLALFGAVFYFVQPEPQLGAPYLSYTRSIIPIDSTENVGTTTAPWDEGHFNQICLNTDCQTSWPSGSGSFSYDAWTHPTAGVSATTSALTIAGLTLTGFSDGGLGVNSGLVYSGATTTFSGGLTYASGNVTNSLTAGDGLTRTVDDIDCDTASGTTFGCLTSANWTTFNGKENALTFNYPFKRTTNTLDFDWTYPLPESATSTKLTLSGGAVIGSGTGLALLTSGDVGTYSGASCTNQFPRSSNASGAWTCATVANTDLANSTISGIALGSNLADLSATDSTLTFSASYNGGTARTVGLNLSANNAWTGTGTTTFAGGISATGSGLASSKGVTISGGDLLIGSAFRVNSAGALISTANITTSGILTTTGSLDIPSASLPSLTTEGYIAIETVNAASSSALTFHDGTQQTRIYDTSFGSFSYSTSTLEDLGAFTWDAGNIDAGFGNGSATTTGSCSAGGTLTTPSENNTWHRGTQIYVEIATDTSGTTTIPFLIAPRTLSLEEFYCSYRGAPNAIINLTPVIR